MLDALGIELLKHGYRAISYIELHCSRCGDIRGGVEEDEPAEVQRCPFCRTLCISKTLGRGFTRQAKIRWETYCRPVSTITLLRDLKGRIRGSKGPRGARLYSQQSVGLLVSRSIPEKAAISFAMCDERLRVRPIPLASRPYAHLAIAR